MNLSDLPPIPPGGFYRGIVYHWSAGRYLNVFSDYHFCILGPPRDGEVIASHDPRNNLRQIGSGMRYAAHTYRRNSGRLGIAVMAMYRATANDYGDYPSTIKQVETMCAIGALCVVRYGMAMPLRDQVETHYRWAIADDYWPSRWDFQDQTEMLVRKTAWYVQQLAGRIP